MKPDALNMLLNGQWVQASANETVLAMIINSGLRVLPNERFAVCGMGVCQDCAVEIDGLRAQLACLRYCQDGMRVNTHG